MRYSMTCGCSFLIDEQELVKQGKAIDYYQNENLIPPIIFNARTDCREECKYTWEFIETFGTKTVFQLESQLGQQWTKELKPTCIEHLAALGALLRPGPMESVDENGINMTKHYCLRKNGLEETTPYHPVVDAILGPTYGVLTYQEQSILLSQMVAGFTLQEADILRKAIGKKLAEEMAKCKKMFLDGVEKSGVITKEQGEQIFGWIEKSQRYSFNKSHAVAYGINGFRTAYCKAHFTVQTYTAFLKFAKERLEPLIEIAEIINDAKRYGLEIYTPDFFKMKEHFHTDGKSIWFGISDVKDVGPAQYKKIKALQDTAKQQYHTNLEDLNWDQFLVLLSDDIGSRALKNLIAVNAFRGMIK